jgi:hypothetical protein
VLCDNDHFFSVLRYCVLLPGPARPARYVCFGVAALSGVGGKASDASNRRSRIFDAAQPNAADDGPQRDAVSMRGSMRKGEFRASVMTACALRLMTGLQTELQVLSPVFQICYLKCVLFSQYTVGPILRLYLRLGNVFLRALR